MRTWLASAATVAMMACARTAAPEPVTSVGVTREFALTMHAESSFSSYGRAVLELSALRWRVVTDGRVRISFVYDLDFEDEASYREHLEQHHSLLFTTSSESSLVQRLDEELGGPSRLVLAATSELRDRIVVVLVEDRIDPRDLSVVVTHELGHVFGLPDLESMGSVMSGAHGKGQAAQEFSPDDIQLCRSYRYCS